MQLTIGSSRLRNTDGFVTVRGRRQISLEWGPFDSQLLLTMDLYAAGGGRIARLRRNYWTFNDNRRFDFAATARGFHLVDTKSGQVVLEARVEGRDSVVITQGVFYNSAGQQIEVTGEDWNGVPDSRTSKKPAAESTNPPFAMDEIASIRKAVLTSSTVIQCPRCGSPLACEQMAGAARRRTLFVSCVICRRNVVVHGQS